ncbi:MAG TPA: YncE family protein [Candidatus Acidoferrales bacterium]|jgi:DNA-binding beta-propeller fold protein YncE|nr:YncE family protein [Candidatus Acidoferrales bacterium]
MPARRFLGVLSWGCVLAFALLIFSPTVFHGAPQDSGYRVLRSIHLGGEGGWDYVTVDSAARRVYIPRSTHIMVIDADSGKLVADIQGMNGLHGVAVAPEFNRGFVTGNKTEQEGTIYIFDLKTSMLTSSIKSNSIDTDSLIYDPSTKRVYVNNGDGMNVTVVDAATAKVVGTMPFNANPEAAAADGKGSIFQDYEDKGQVIEYDAKALTIKNKWPTPGCDAPVAMAMDKANRRLYVGCRGKAATAPGVMIVMNADTGKIMASMPIAIGVDGDVFDPDTGNIYATCRDSGDGKTGATYIFHADSPDKISLVATVKTIYGARTVALDSKTHHVFSIGTEQNDPLPATAKNPNPRPKPVLSTFELLEIGK